MDRFVVVGFDVLDLDGCVVVVGYDEVVVVVGEEDCVYVVGVGVGCGGWVEVVEGEGGGYVLEEDGVVVVGGGEVVVEGGDV